MQPDPMTVLDDCPAPASGLTLKLRAHPSSVAMARDLVTTALAGTLGDHLWAVVQCTSELLTNALAAAERCAGAMQPAWSDTDTPVRLTACTTPRWTRIDVRDPEPRLHPVRPHQVLDEGGRGIEIIMALGHFAYTLGADHKVVHALIPVGDPLTDDERDAALPRDAVAHGGHAT